MDLEDMKRHAAQTFSKLQTHTYYLTHIQMMDLLSVFERIAKDFPDKPDCEQIRQDKLARITIDGYMDEMRQILSVDAGTDAPMIAYIALNFTWKKQYRYLSVGEMRMWVAYTDSKVHQQRPRSLDMFRCVSTRDKMRMDEILPERNVEIFRRFSASHLVLESNLPAIFDLTLRSFKRGNVKDLNKLALLLDTKQNDAILYFNGTFSYNADDKHVIIKLHVSDEKHSYHYAIQIPGDKSDIIAKFKETLFTNKEPVKMLRSYASRKNLLFMERVYYVPEQAQLLFYEAMDSAPWNKLGEVVVAAQRQWAESPPYSGVFPTYFALCVEGNTFHLAVHLSHKDVKVATFILVHGDELRERTREFFPDAKYVKAVRNYALNPGLTLKPEDVFLEPYVLSQRYKVITQNVRAPTNKNLPKNLTGQIEKWRAHYRRKLRQHVSKHPQDAELLGLHQSYAKEVADMAREAQLQKAIRQFVHTDPLRQVPDDHPFRKQIQQERRVRQQTAKHHAKEVAGMVRKAHLQKAIRQFVHTKPAQQVPADHPFRKQIQQERQQAAKHHAKKVASMVREAHLQKAIRQFVHTDPLRHVPDDHPFRKEIQQQRRRVRQQAAKYADAEELEDKMLEDLNLLDPISGKRIKDPVRSPYTSAGIYQKQSLSQWLGRGGLRLDPLSRKEMPTTFVPQTDKPLKKFLQMELYPKIDKIMRSKQADDVKKERLIGLRQQLARDKVFQKKVIKQKK